MFSVKTYFSFENYILFIYLYDIYHKIANKTKISDKTKQRVVKNKNIKNVRNL